MSAAHTDRYSHTKQTVHTLTLLIQQDIVWLDISKGDNNRHISKNICLINKLNTERQCKFIQKHCKHESDFKFLPMWSKYVPNYYAIPSTTANANISSWSHQVTAGATNTPVRCLNGTIAEQEGATRLCN